MKEVKETKIKITEAKDLFDEGYNLLSKIREDVDAPVAKAKFLTEEIITVYGKDAAEKFYDPSKFKRSGAMPTPVLKTLFGEDGVQTLDGKAHHHRKNYFMDLMVPDRMDDYVEILDRKLTEKLDAQHGKFELFDLANIVLFEAIAEWSGINLDTLTEEEIEDLAKNQISMISGAVTSPTDHLKGISDRKDSEEWAEGLIKEARKNPVPGKENHALYTFAQATDLEGELLPVEVAAVELLNIIRPTV
ncbi:MAG: cytochrome P450, partial [Tetragenococcus halophilus]|nr:cytochrome P450 [Tetragenococcus halophilus]